MRKILITLCLGLCIFSNALAQVVIDGIDYGSTYTLSSDINPTTVSIEIGSVLTIPNGRVLNVSGTLKSPKSSCLIIEDGGQLVGGQAKTNVTYKKELASFRSGNRWYTLSDPVQCPINSVFSGVVGDDYDIYYYDEPTHYWMSYKNGSTDMFTGYQAGRGYLCAVKETSTLEFVGKLKTSASVLLSNTEGAGVLKGFNLIGNPYTHDIYKGAYQDGSTVINCAISDDHLATGYYKLNGDGEWVPYRCSAPIKPGEGVLLKTNKSGSNSLTIVNTTEVAEFDYNIVPWGKSLPNELAISVDGTGGKDRVYIYFCDGIGLDKIEHLSETAPSLFVRYDDTDYAIAHVDKDCQSLDVMFNIKQSGFYTLSLDDTKYSFDYLHLVDNETGDDIDMLAQKDYKFYAFGNEDEHRFRLIMNKVDETIVMDDNVFAYMSNGDIVITGLNTIATLQMFDMAGRLIYNDVLAGSAGSVCRVSKPRVTGVFVLRLITNNCVKTQKIVVE